VISNAMPALPCYTDNVAQSMPRAPQAWLIVTSNLEWQTSAANWH